MKKYIIAFTAFLLLFITIKTKGQTTVRPLKIGDKVPDIVIKHLLGNRHDMRLADLYRDNVLIINFWATWCGSCIKEMPVLDSLAAANKGKLKVLLVAYEKEKTVNSFFRRHPEINTANVLVSTDDTVLINYFKHVVLPHNVWVDRNGIVKYITGGEEVTAKNIAKFIKNQSMDLFPKIDLADFDIWAPFHLSDSVFIYRSIFTAFIDGIVGGYTADWVWKHPTERWLNRFFTYDSSKQQMLWNAVNRLISNQDYYDIMRIETPDSTRFFWPNQCPQSFAKSKYKSRLEWEHANAFCYELTLPTPVKDTVFFSDMLIDLERICNVKINIENKVIPTCVLSLAKGHAFQRPQNDSTYINLQKNHLSAHNVGILHLFDFLNEKIKTDKNKKSDDPPYVDETGIKTRIDLDIDFGKDFPTYAEVKKIITEKYGIQFRLREHLYPIVIIKDLTP